MDKLWVRLSFAISSVIALIFMVIFVSLYTVFTLPELEVPALGDTFNALWWEIPEAILKAVVYANILGVIAGVFVSWIISKPLRKLVIATRKIGQGDLATRIDIGGSVEIDELATTFNQMAVDLKAAQDRRKQMMSDVAHELRTPLTVLEGNLRAAIDDVYDLGKADLAMLYGQTRHLIHIVNDLRELSLAEAKELILNRQPLQVDALLGEMVDMFEPFATEQSITLEVSIAPELPVVHVDVLRLRQVLQNLIANAIRHSNTNGVVTISVEASRGSLDNPALQLSVQDRGDGIGADQLDMIFDRFARAGKQRADIDSTGLGLAISKAIVEAHDGKIYVQSAGVDAGATFVVEIPT